MMCLGCSPIGRICTYISQDPIGKTKPMPHGSIGGIKNEKIVTNLISIICLEDKSFSETKISNSLKLLISLGIF